MDKTNSSLLQLQQNLSEGLLKVHKRVDFERLVSAVENRITAARGGYISPFTCLYKSINKRADEFKDFERGLKGVLPIFKSAPNEAPSDSGRNARWGAAPCAVVVVILKLGKSEYVSSIKPEDDQDQGQDDQDRKLLGGKCDPKYDVIDNFKLDVTV